MYTLPVIWSRAGRTYAGRLELTAERLVLESRGESFSFAIRSVSTLAIGRSPADRLRGLPTLRLVLAGGEIVHIASLGGAGSLRELAALLGARQPAVSGT